MTTLELEAGAAGQATDPVISRRHGDHLAATATWYEPPHPYALTAGACHLAATWAREAGWEPPPPPGHLRTGAAPCHPDVAEHLIYVARMANRHLWSYVLGTQVVLPRVLRYTAGDELTWHTDHNPWTPADPVAKLTVIALLTDPDTYTGGHLEWSLGVGLERRLPRTQGTIVVWPTTLMHRLTPLLEGERLSIQGKVTGPPLR